MAGTVISSAAVNSDFSDIASALTGSFARDGQSPMLGQFRAVDGGLAAPGISFGNETNTGFTRPGAGQIGTVIQGVQVATFSSVGIVSTTPTQAALDNSTKLASTGYVDAAITAAQTFAAGTVVLFYQTSAPTGWTKIVTQNDKALRVVSGSGGVAGGTNAFSTVFAQTVVGNHTDSTAEMPSHAHGTALQANTCGGAGTVTYLTGGGGGASLSTGAQGGGGAHNHTITMSIQFIDIILCSKN